MYRPGRRWIGAALNTPRHFKMRGELMKQGITSTETWGAAAILGWLYTVAESATSDAVTIACVIVAGAVVVVFAVCRTMAKRSTTIYGDRAVGRGVPNIPNTIPPPPWGPPTPSDMIGPIPLLVIAMTIGMLGCATPSATNRIGPNGPIGNGSPVSMATMDSDGLQVGSYQGAAPTNIKQDSDGAWITTPGQGGATVINMPGGVTAYIWSPTDGEVDSIEIDQTGDGMTLKITGLRFNISDHARIIGTMYTDAMGAIKDMTQTEATRRVEELRIAGTITSDIASAIIANVIPGLPIQ